MHNKKPSQLRRLIQILSNKIFVDDIVIRNIDKNKFVVKSVAGNVITVQDPKYKHVEIAMSVKAVKKAKLLTFIEFDIQREIPY